MFSHTNYRLQLKGNPVFKKKFLQVLKVIKVTRAALRAESGKTRSFVPEVVQYYSFFPVNSPTDLAKCPTILVRVGYSLTSAIVQKMCSHYLAPRLPFVRQHGAHILSPKS